MSAGLLQESPSNAQPSAAPTVDVDVDELIIDRAISCPVYDKDGMLLIAAGCTITAEIKRNLKARHVAKIAVSAADADVVTLGRIAADDSAGRVQLDSELTSRLDQIIDSSNLEVQNRGPAVKERVVFLGKKGYDSKQREKLLENHQENGRALGDMIQTALRGNTLDGQCLAQMTSTYVDELTRDTDSAVTSAMSCVPDNAFIERSLEVTMLAMAIGIECGYDGDHLRDLGVCALVNDWGMMKVPQELRESQRRLTAMELLEIKKHPIYSLEMLQKVSSLPQIASIVAYQVHESPNGKGYPRGRKGNSIHPFARIIHVADAYVALTKARPYRPPFMRYSAMENMILMARDRSVDPDMVRNLLRIQSLFPIGSLVALSDGSVARVMRRNVENYTQPLVQRIQDKSGRRVEPAQGEEFIDLAESGLAVVQALPNPGSGEISFDRQNADSAAPRDSVANSGRRT